MTVINSASIDVTTLFKSCVKTIRTRNKAIGVTFPQSKILPSSPATQFFIKSRDIQANIASHEHLLYEHKKKYLSDNATSFSDIERAYMEKVISRNLKFIEDNIRNLELDIKENLDSSFSDNAKECQQCVINILRTNFLKTSANFRDMKDHRQKKQKEKEQLFRLQRPSGLKKQANMGEEKRTLLRQRKSSERIPVENLGSTNFHREEKSITEGASSEGKLLVSTESSEDSKSTARGSSPSHYDSSFFEDEIEGTLKNLGEEERQLLEEENVHLYNDLMSNKEEVKQITKQVVELSRMQDILTENVEIQAQEIEEIHDTILHATDNVQRGNEQVREAMRKDAGFRVWIMFFLIVMSCTVLFLDWYNP